LRVAATSPDRSHWNSLDPKTWANESLKITTSEAVSYCVKKDGDCWNESDNMKVDGNEERRVVVVDNAYMEQQWPVIKKRLTQARTRLGHLLYQVLGGQ